MKLEKILYSKWAPWGIFLLAAWIFSLNLGERDFWAPDEPDFALVVKEMRERGDYLVPYFNGKPYSEKPPLLYWSVVASQEIAGGPNEFAARLPSVIAGAAALALVFILGRWMFSPLLGLAGAVVLATSPQFLWRSVYLQTDALFTGFLTLAFVLLWRILSKPKSKFFHLPFAFYVVLALAVLCKGPLAIVLVMLTLVIYLWGKEKRETVQKLYLVPGLALVGLLTAWWYVWVGLAAGEEFLQGAFIREHLLRFWDSDSHNQPFYYYFLSIWGDLAPWSIFLPFALWLAWKNRSDKRIRFLFCWFVAIFLFLSLCSAKIGKYLLPAFPAVALLVVWSLQTAAAQLHTKKWIDWGLNSIACAFFLIGMTSIVLSMMQWIPPAIFNEFPEVSAGQILPFLAIAHGFASFGILALVFHHKSPVTRVFLLSGGMLCAFIVLTNFYKELNGVKSARPFMERIAQEMDKDAKLATITGLRGGYGYYSGRAVEQQKLADLPDYFNHRDPRYCLLYAREYPAVQKVVQNKIPVWLIDRDYIGHQEYYVVANRPPKKMGSAIPQ